MAILSDYEEEDHQSKAKPSSSSSSSAKQFNGELDPSNPLGFIESVLEFVARESNMFKSDSVVKDVNSLVRVVKEKVEAEERKKTEKKIQGNGKPAEKVIKAQPTEKAPAPTKEEGKKPSEAAESKQDEDEKKKSTRGRFL